MKIAIPTRNGQVDDILDIASILPFIRLRKKKYFPKKLFHPYRVAVVNRT